MNAHQLKHMSISPDGHQLIMYTTEDKISSIAQNIQKAYL